MLPTIPLFLKLLMTLTLSALSVVLYFALKCEARRLCMFAILLSTAGDFFMTDALGIGGFSTYIGAGLFIVAHGLYADCFRRKAKAAGYKYFGGGFFAGLFLMLVSAIALGVAAFTVPAEPRSLMFFLILVYIAVIGYNLCSNFAFSFSAGGVYLLLPFAITLFYATDVFIFLDMLNISHALRQYVWYGYPIAQLLLILFNSPLRKGLEK